MDQPAAMVLADIGPWDQYKTITNAAEKTVLKCHVMGLGKRRLFYFDSDNDLTELLHDGNGKFVNFKNAHPSILDEEQ
jgi:hypothetical protein